MKGKSIFTTKEAALIEQLIELKLRASTNEQKTIRHKIRTLGFYATDFGVGGGYTVADFRRVVKIIDGKAGLTESTARSTTTKKETFTPTPQPTPSPVSALLSLNHASDVLEQLHTHGFQGFLPITDITSNYALVPKVRGIYIVLKIDGNAKFRAIGSGGHFRKKDPNVTLEVLKAKWVDTTPIVYIGKAGTLANKRTLHSRLREYFRFGQGEPIGHWGGRYIWQLEHPEKLVVCWKEINDVDPTIVETALIQEFTAYHGRRPFANLKT
jgi:hypothetical protein